MTTTHYEETETRTTLQPSTYTARAREWSWDTDRDGNPCLALMFEIEGGEHAGYQIEGRLFLDETKADKNGRTALDRSMEALRAMGLKGDLVADLAGLDAGTVEIVTDINEKGYAKIKYINAPRAARELRTFAPPDAGSLGGFLAKINARSRAIAARVQASGTVQVSPQPQRPAAPAQRAASANAAPRPQQTQQRAQQPAQRQAPPRMPPSGSQDFGADDEIPF